MSMARCDKCARLIDTDFDPESCLEDGYICEPCRDEYLEESFRGTRTLPNPTSVAEYIEMKELRGSKS